MQDRPAEGIEAVPGLRVLEVGRHLAVASAGLSLAALGADVAQARLDGRTLKPEESVYYDRGRRGVVEGPASELGRLVPLADVILTDLADREMEGCGIPLGAEGLRSGDRPQVLVSVRSLGRTGPNSGFRMTDLTEWASSGLAQVTRRPHPGDVATYVPVLPPGSQPQALAGLAAATAAVVGLRWAGRVGEPMTADVSVQEVVAAMLHGVFPNFVWNGVVTGNPATPATSLGLMLPASDGDVYIRTLDPRQWDALMQWVDLEAVRAIGVDPDSRLANNDAIRMLLSEWSAPKRRIDLITEGQRRRIPIALPRSIDDVLAWEHLAVRGVWRPVDVDGAQAVAPRIPLLEPEVWAASTPATLLEVARRWTPTGVAAPSGGARGARLARPAAHSPLEGVRVLDFGWTWAGPYCGMILTDLGADVIKVETSHRLDMLRLSGAFADGVRDHERCGWYGATNRGKRSITVNLKHPEGHGLMVDLIRMSDVAIENFAPRVLPELRLGWQDMESLNPRMILLSLSAYGASGPEREYVAYGDHLGYASGLASVIGHPDDGPTPINTFYGDPVAGMYGALAIVAALAERERSGRGRHLEYSQVEGLLTMIPGPIVSRSSGRVVERLVDKSPRMAPHGFYRCAGDDAWVAVAVETDEGWHALRELLIRSGVQVDELPRLSDRKSAEAVLDAAVAEWTATRSPWQVTSACQRLGVAAHPMMNSARIAWDAHLHQRDFLQWVTHPVVGPAPVPGVVFRIGEQGCRVRGPAPTMGEHNEEVLVELLGITPDRYHRLVADGAVS